MPIELEYRANSVYALLRGGWRTQGEVRQSGYGAVGGSGVTPHPMSAPINEQFITGYSWGNEQLGIPPAAVFIDREIHDSVSYEVPEWEWKAYIDEIEAKPGLRVLWHCRLRHGQPVAYPHPDAPVAARIALKTTERLMQSRLIVPLTNEQAAAIKQDTPERRTALDEIEDALAAAR